MAATVSAWAKPGAWALEVEEQDAAAITAAPEESEFPSLSAAAATKGSKKKTKNMTLAEYITGKPVAQGAAKFRPSAANSAPTAEIFNLPTGPRERTAEEIEMLSSRGFNYSSYGGGPRGGGPRVGGEESGGSRWGSGRGSDEPRRSAFGDRDSGPSRADEIDDWGASKKSMAPPMEKRERMGGFFDNHSKADDSDSWVSNKGPAPPSEGRRMGDGYRERRGFEMYREGSNGFGRGGPDADSWGKKREEINDAGSGGRPRLVLQPRTLPLENGNGDQRPEKPEVVAPKRNSNPFGAARPREEVLAEKGQDWKEIEEKLEMTKIREVRPISREGSGFGRRSSGIGNGPEERTWRKPDSTGTPSPPGSTTGKVDENTIDN